MSFLAPLFLAGLAALAIPVVIHLINRERKEVVQGVLPLRAKRGREFGDEASVT